MTTAFFVIGALTSIGCGLVAATSPADWKGNAVWLAGGTVGAAMMYIAMTGAACHG